MMKLQVKEIKLLTPPETMPAAAAPGPDLKQAVLRIQRLCRPEMRQTSCRRW